MKNVRAGWLLVARLALGAGLALLGNACKNELSEWPKPCVREPVVADILEQMDAEQWLGAVRKLSGAEAVVVDGVQTTIATRDTRIMFSGAANARGFAWLLEQLRANWPEEAIEIQEYRERDPLLCDGIDCTGWRNLTVTRRGDSLPDEEVLITAHLDSISSDAATEAAPGADDNATGAATLLELARILPGRALRRTLRLVWFTGEEQGIKGSPGWLIAHATAGLRGTVNLDVLGWDGDQNHSVEVHDSGSAASAAIGRCVVDTIATYDFDLVPQQRSGDDAVRTSDHVSFWQAGIEAVLVTAGFSGEPSGGSAEPYDPNLHTARDTVDKIAMPYAFDVARAAAAAALTLAEQ